jgi:hypothetical protein
VLRQSRRNISRSPACCDGRSTAGKASISHMISAARPFTLREKTLDRTQIGAGGSLVGYCCCCHNLRLEAGSPQNQSIMLLL